MNDFKRILSIILLCLGYQFISAQQASLSGKVLTNEGQAIPQANLLVLELKEGTAADNTGAYSFQKLPMASLRIQVSCIGFQKQVFTIELKEKDVQMNFILEEAKELLEEVTLKDKSSEKKSLLRLKSIEHTAIYASKKNEVINLRNTIANKSSNNARQVFAKVPGVTVWESDCAGLQLGIGARGLSPDRTSNFNTRQNGYDMAADALGYPESYYAPPMQALEKIEIVRGAASLQYGTQFGGMVNLKLKKGDPNRKFAFSSMNTYNSVGHINTFNDVGGQIGKTNYYSFINYRTGSCNRPNTDFYNLTLHGRLAYDLTSRLKVSFEFTHMEYLAQQAGGLTDMQFEQDPYQSLRERNWFAVDWNLSSVNLDYTISDQTTLSSNTFALLGSRKALGFIQIPSRQDGPEFANRDLLVDHYKNLGNETRILHRYKLNDLPSAFLIGLRTYRGNTSKQQGFGSAGIDADFNFVDENHKLLSDYKFPSTNLALFSENVFNLTQHFSITPGARIEHINTRAEGFFDSSIRIPLTGEIVVDSITEENRNNNRSLLLMGIGASYTFNNGLELYGNFSQNYRAITFNNLRVTAPAYDIDPNLQDEKGFNADLGLRGNLYRGITLDAGFFLLNYYDKIGSVVRIAEDNLGNIRIIRYTTNVADATIGGIEAYIEVDWLQFIEHKSEWNINTFLNIAHIKGQYYNSIETAIDGNKVEHVPDWNLKTGVSGSYKNVRASIQFSHLSSQFSDATNAENSSSGIYGAIPEYWVLDFSSEYQWKWVKAEFGINNITNNAYFTRRALGYPGPGIIPAAPRNFYIGLGVSL